MKAKEYFEKYPADQAIDYYKLFMDFSEEVIALVKVRHVTNDNGLIPIMKEQNDKWNALHRLYLKNYGYSPISYDGFLNCWNAHLKDKSVRGII